MKDDLISKASVCEILSDIYPTDGEKVVAVKEVDKVYEAIQQLPSAKPEQEDYTEMKREFLRMASYIDSLLVCPDEQKETLMNFISRIAEFMPWTERD